MLAMASAADSFSRLRELLAQASRVAVVTHRNADPDALGAVAGLLRLCRHLGVECDCILPEGLSAASKRLLEALRAEMRCLDTLQGGYDLYVIVDTSSPDQLGSFSRITGEDTGYVVVDHHSANQLVEGAVLSIYDPDAPSSSELVASLLAESSAEVEGWEAGLLLGGILYDTRRFLRARRETFTAAAYLLGRGADYGAVVSALQRRTEEEYSERVARLKAAARSRVFAADNILLVVTHVGAFESSAARALLDLGADVAIVVSEQKGGVRVSGRAKPLAVSRGIRLGGFMEGLAEKMGGTGGGHDAAAGATGAVGLEEALEIIVRELEHYLRDLGMAMRELG